MKLTEGKIKEAQEIIEAVMEECRLDGIGYQSIGNEKKWTILFDNKYQRHTDIVTLYINRLHEMNGTQAPLF